MVEIRTTLQGVLPAGELLTDTMPQTPEQKELAARIVASALRLGPLADDYAMFAAHGAAEVADLLLITEELMATSLTPQQRELASIVYYCSQRLDRLRRLL
jgi:signal transduction histidine kinase